VLPRWCGCKYLTYIVSPFRSDRPRFSIFSVLPCCDTSSRHRLATITCETLTTDTCKYSRSHQEDIRPTTTRWREQRFLPICLHQHFPPSRSILLPCSLCILSPLHIYTRVQCSVPVCYLSVGCPNKRPSSGMLQRSLLLFMASSWFVVVL